MSHIQVGQLPEKQNWMQILRVSAFLIQIQVGQLVVKAQLLILLMEEKRGQFKTHLPIVTFLVLTL